MKCTAHRVLPSALLGTLAVVVSFGAVGGARPVGNPTGHEVEPVVACQTEAVWAWVSRITCAVRAFHEITIPSDYSGNHLLALASTPTIESLLIDGIFCTVSLPCQFQVSVEPLQSQLINLPPPIFVII